MAIVHIQAPGAIVRERFMAAGSPPNPDSGEKVSLFKLEAFSTPDSRIKSGTWEATPGRFRRAIVDAEFSHFIAGHATFAADDGQVIDFRAGDAAYLPAGTQGTWTIHTTLRKTYVVWRDNAQPVAG